MRSLSVCERTFKSTILWKWAVLLKRSFGFLSPLSCWVPKNWLDRIKNSTELLQKSNSTEVSFPPKAACSSEQVGHRNVTVTLFVTRFKATKHPCDDILCNKDFLFDLYEVGLYTKCKINPHLHGVSDSLGSNQNLLLITVRTEIFKRLTSSTFKSPTLNSSQMIIWRCNSNFPCLNPPEQNKE